MYSSSSSFTSSSSSTETPIKYVVVSGGVMSGIGKGVTASSIGLLLKARGFRVTCIKMDPYLNFDAGLMSPFEHGEVFVLDDGGESDLDLGNYERFLNITLNSDNNITTGKIYQKVISKERKGEYLGKTVQVVPHVTNEIQDWIERVAKVPVDGSEQSPEICVIELGGTIGDIESSPFVEALRQFQFRIGTENIAFVHVSLITTSAGEQKTKPTQRTVKDMRALGLFPDALALRAQSPLELDTVRKIGSFCHVSADAVWSVHDVSNLYRVPLVLLEQHVDEFLARRLNLSHMSLSASKQSMEIMTDWEALADTVDNVTEEVHIAIVGKYTGFKDSYLSLIKALQHASYGCKKKLILDWVEASDLEESSMGVGKTTMQVEESNETEDVISESPSKGKKRSRPSENDGDDDDEEGNVVSQSSMQMEDIMAPARERAAKKQAVVDQEGQEGDSSFEAAWKLVKNADGILIPGGFGDRGVEGKIAAAKYAREEKKPLFGICLGFQTMVMEYARNVLGLVDANSTENIEDCATPVVIFMPEISKDTMGGNMRLGARVTRLQTKDCLAYELYNQQMEVKERHRHRYEVNPEFVDKLENAGLKFVGQDETGQRMEIVELDREVHPFYIGVQYHPEYLTRPTDAHPVFLGFVKAAAEGTN